MVEALAPRLRRGSSWVWLWMVTISLAASPIFAQTGEPKNAAKNVQAKSKDTPKKDAPKAQTPAKGAAKAAAPAKDEDDDNANRRDSGEIFKDPRAEKALANTFRELPYPNPRPTASEITSVRNMASGQIGPDRAVISRYIDHMAAELTNHTNIKALIDPGNISPRAAAARAIEQASDGLIEPLTIARAQQNTAFLSVYLPLLQSKLPALLDNHLYARIQAAIVLGMAGNAASIDTFVKQLADPNQVIWVKVWAAKGITNATQNGQVALETQKGTTVAATLVALLEREANLPWPAQLRILEAIGANRLASSAVIDRKADVLSAITKTLADSQARPDVRAWAAWASGLLTISNSIPKVNYPLLSYHIGLLAAEIGDKICAEYDATKGRFERNKGPASYLTGLLLMQIEPALVGVSTVKGSGILNSSHPSAVANKPFAQGLEGQVRNVGKAALDLVRAGGTAQEIARKDLAAKVTDLRAFLQKNRPTDFELIPGGLKVPIAPAQVANQ
jgi:hypothetical protein